MNENINELAKKLHLAYLRNNLNEILDESNKQGWSNEQLIENILSYEINDRLNKSIKKKINVAGFPNILTFEQLDLDAFSLDIVDKIKEVKNLNFIENGSNVILCGNSGVGKTHVATALGLLACQQNKSVLFTSVPNLIIELREKAQSNQLTTFKKRFCSYDLVILDELGYISFDKGCSELLFNLLSTRNQNKSLIITTNLSFNRWIEIFGDEVLTAAMVDRITHCSYVLNIQGQSYRIKETKEWLMNKNN